MKLPPGVKVFANGHRYKGEIPDHLAHLVPNKEDKKPKDKPANQEKKGK